MANLGFLGLGIMGYPMARNLLQAGHRLAVWSHTMAKAEKLAAEHGALPCASPKAVGAQSECVFFCVGDTAMSEEVVFGPEGLVHSMAPGTVVVDTSTVSVSNSLAMGERLAEKGIHFLGAPCTGSKPGAEAGTLTFMVGGDKEVFERVKPWFEPMGKQLYYCGGPGMGLHAKLSQNLLLSNLLMAFNEAMVLAVKTGVDPELLLDILNNSAARSGLVAFKAPYVFSRNFETNFSVKWMHKDLNLILESGNHQNVPLPLTAVTQQMFRAALAAGYGEEDMCSTIKVLEHFAGVEVKKKS